MKNLTLEGFIEYAKSLGYTITFNSDKPPLTFEDIFGFSMKQDKEDNDD